jgi:hypothetical protein
VAWGAHTLREDTTLFVEQEDQLLLGDFQLVDRVAWEAAVELGGELLADSLEACGRCGVADDELIAEGLDVLLLVDHVVDHVFHFLW